jgi:hypothetical protein
LLEYSASLHQSTITQDKTGSSIYSGLSPGGGGAGGGGGFTVKKPGLRKLGCGFIVKPGARKGREVVIDKGRREFQGILMNKRTILR